MAVLNGVKDISLSVLKSIMRVVILPFIVNLVTTTILMLFNGIIFSGKEFKEENNGSKELQDYKKAYDAKAISNFDYIKYLFRGWYEKVQFYKEGNNLGIVGSSILNTVTSVTTTAAIVAELNDPYSLIGGIAKGSLNVFGLGSPNKAVIVSGNKSAVVIPSKSHVEVVTASKGPLPDIMVAR